MKRHQSLYPLSHDHHHALVEARNLIVAAEANDRNELDRAAARFIDFWKSDLEMHFSQEEQIVLPLLAKRTSPESPRIVETLDQHSKIVRLTAELQDKLSRRETISGTLLEGLGESLRHHIRFEENELFPEIEAALSEGELRQMNTQLTEIRSGTGRGSCPLITEQPPGTED